MNENPSMEEIVASALAVATNTNRSMEALAKISKQHRADTNVALDFLIRAVAVLLADYPLLQDDALSLEAEDIRARIQRMIKDEE